MKHAVLGFLAETYIHPGTGQNEGEIDLPVAREATTGFPFIAGSSLKGALLDRARPTVNKTDLDRIFGQQNNAGELLVGDARLALLPIRSLQNVYRWITCPLILERIKRDFLRAGLAGVPAVVPRVDNDKYLGAIPDANDKIFLEERQFSRQDEVPLEWVQFLSSLILHPESQSRLALQVTVLDDQDFTWFAKYGLPVQARNVLDENTKESKNLWYEETLPADTVMFSVLAQRKPVSADGSLQQIIDLFTPRPYLQTGGNETVGQGWFAVKALSG